MMQPEQQRRFLELFRSGPGFIAFKPVGSNYFEKHFTSNEEALALIARHGARAETWVSMATFPEPVSRKATYAEKLCAMWVDVDAGHGSGIRYESVSAAHAAVLAFIEQTGIPAPTACNFTGHGVHAIWSFDKKIPREVWQAVADKFQDLLARLDIGADPITADAARILRVAGTINFRDPDDPRVSTLHESDEPYLSLQVFEAAIDAALAKFPVAPAQVAARALARPFDKPETLGNIEIVRNMLAAVDPDLDYPDWRGVVWAVAATGWDCSYGLVRAWSEKGKKWCESTFHKVWHSFRERDGGITFGTLVHHARKAGYDGALLAAEVPGLPDGMQDCERPKPVPHGSNVAGRLITRCAAEIDPEHVEWLVPDSLPLGMLAVIGGEPGLGKSQIAIALAAGVTAGMPLPGGTKFEDGGSVIFLANEDDAARTLRPRLEAAGANARKVHVVEGVARAGAEIDLFQLDEDVADLRALAMHLGDVRLIVIDPPTAYLGSKVDSYKESDVRRVLLPLNTLAQQTGALILLVVHLNKRNDGGSPQQRFSGSTAWIAAPRAGFIVLEDPTDKQRYMLPAKVNVGNDRLGYGYKVTAKTVEIKGQKFATSKVEWAGTTQRPVRELLNSPKTERTSAVDEAAEFLREELAAGPRSVQDLRARAKDAGIAWGAVQRAKKQCVILPQKMADHWQWSMLAPTTEELLDHE